MELFGKLILWFAPILVSVIFTVLLQDWLLSLLASFFGGRFSKNRTIRGLWKTDYKYQSSQGGWKEDDPKLEVRLFGKYFFANGKSTIDGSIYKLKGEIHDGNVVTGDWHEWTKTHKYYHGVFQLILSPIENKMEGRWLGHSRAGGVRSGSWLWEKDHS